MTAQAFALGVLALYCVGVVLVLAVWAVRVLRRRRFVALGKRYTAEMDRITSGDLAGENEAAA